MISKICPSCGRKVPVGSKCSCRRGAALRNKRREDRSNKVTDPFYSSAAWQRKRAAVRSRYLGVDVLELYRTGKVVPAEMVHHIIPRRERPELRFDDKNLIPLSNRTHETVEAFYQESPERKHYMQQELYAAIEFFQNKYGPGRKRKEVTETDKEQGKTEEG